MEIKKGKPCHPSNYYSHRDQSINFIVIHYTGNNGDTAEGNCNYFSAAKRGASAHYFVGDDGIYQSVPDNCAAWAVGGTQKYKHSLCRNMNSISVEMCSRKDASGKYYIAETVIRQTVELTQYLMKKYCISVNCVLRHYDVWDKKCPEPFVRQPELWDNFKKLLTLKPNQEHWAEQYRIKLEDAGYVTDDIWKNYDCDIPVSYALALLDKMSGGTWPSDEADKSVHWAQPNIISLCGKGIISDKTEYINLVSCNANLSNALCLALTDKATGGMIKTALVDVYRDHWGRNHLDSLCEKKIVSTPDDWTNFEGAVTYGNFMALMCKAFKI